MRLVRVTSPDIARYLVSVGKIERVKGVTVTAIDESLYVSKTIDIAKKDGCGIITHQRSLVFTDEGELARRSIVDLYRSI